MRRNGLRSLWRGSREPARAWDEELERPQSEADRRRARTWRRAVVASVVLLLVAVVATTLVVSNVGDGGTQTAKVSVDETTASTRQGESPGAFLPTPVTAISLGGQVVVPDPATTLPPLLTVPGAPATVPTGPDGQALPTEPGATQPANTQPGATQPPATQPGTTRPATTAPATTRTTSPPTTQPPPFTYDQPHQATGAFTNGQGSAACPAPVPPERQGQFVLSTPQPGVLDIARQGAAVTASGPIDRSGTFHVSSAATGETYDGQATGSGATASYLQDDGKGCTVTYNVVFTFT